MAVSVALPAMIVTGIHFHAVQIYLDIGMAESDAVAMVSVFADVKYCAVYHASPESIKHFRLPSYGPETKHGRI